VRDTTISSIKKTWNKKDRWMDLKTIEKISPEYDIYLYEDYKKGGGGRK